MSIDQLIEALESKLFFSTNQHEKDDLILALNKANEVLKNGLLCSKDAQAPKAD